MSQQARLIAAALALAGGAVPTSAQAPVAQAEEIVVTAQRIGVPVWRVDGPATTLVLVGSISGVSRQTRWDPGALEATLRKADRVLYPGRVGIALNPFTMAGYYLKFKRMGTLPKGKSLTTMLPPDQYRRLRAFQQRGILKAGFERRHPLHLSIDLRNRIAPEKGDAPGIESYVRQAVKKHKIRTVPIRRVQAKPIARNFWATPPEAYIPCLVASISLVEAGPGVVKARSDAWAQRRVPEVLASPLTHAYDRCVPPALEAVDKPDVAPQIRGLLSDPQVTVAVVGLGTLAKPGGVLDDLSAAGFRVRGPRWKS